MKTVRKLRWPFGILVTIALVALAFVFKKPSDDFADVRPFIVGDRTDYLPTGSINIIPPPPMPSPAFSSRIIFVKDIDQDKVLTQLANRVTHFRGTWTIKYKQGRIFSFHAISPGNEMDDLRASGQQWPSGSSYSIEEVHELSAFDILSYRIRHGGKSPFTGMSPAAINPQSPR